MPREGLKAKLAGRPILPMAKELVEIASEGLERQAKDKKSEGPFLEPIRERILRPGLSPGEALIRKWNEKLSRDPQKLIQDLAI